jgi:hypothetical protein
VRFTSTNEIGSWLGPSRSGRRGGQKLLTLAGLELRPLSQPVRNQSLYRLLYPVFSRISVILTKIRPCLRENLQTIVSIVNRLGNDRFLSLYTVQLLSDSPSSQWCANSYLAQCDHRFPG